MAEYEEILVRLASGSSSRADYISALELFDSTICEALAVGQAQAGRMATPCIGYATHIHARLCAYGVAAIRAAPLSRWAHSESQYWHFSVLACHARAILEGYLYFTYLAQPANDSLDESRARVTLLQLNDCCSRLKLLSGDPESAAFFASEAEKLRNRLRSIPYFQQMPRPVQETCLAGKKAWFMDRAQLVELVGMDKQHFDMWWDLFSQHSHIHPVSFFRNVRNERGSGLECDPDRSYLASALVLCAQILESTTERMVQWFPDVAWARKGVQSKFSPGPKSNRRR